jgi:hypothetical protein
VEGLRRQLTELVDHRSPKSKSPVLVQLIWLGDELLAPGRSVKLAAAAFDPTSVESAPFSGLTFFCTEFEEGDQLDKYAIAAGPIAAATSADGTLSTRTDDDTGTLTMSGGHGIETGDTIVLQWDGGARYSVEVGTVAGNSVPIDNGRGDVLPDAMTPVTVIRSAEIGYGVIPEAYWAKVDVTDDTHTRAIAAAGTLLSSAASGGIPIIWKPSGTGEKWCVVSIVSREDRLVAADPTDGVPRELIDKLANTSVFDPEEHQLVYGQLRLDAINTPPDNTVRLFTAKSEGSETERFRLFELWDRKYLVEGAATVRWLDHNLQPNLGEEPETISDELHVFAGAAAGYEPWQSEMTRGMRGIAELWNDRPHSVSGTLMTRTDDDTGVLTLSAMHGVMDGNTVDVYWGEDGEFSRLGMTVGTVATNDVPVDGGTGDNLPTVSTAVHVVNESAVLGDPLWHIIAMEGFAAWLKGTIDFDDGPEIFQIQTSAIKQDHGWDHIIPVSTGGIVPLADDSDIYSPFDGDKVLALLDDPDTDPPTYRVFRGRGRDRRSIRGLSVGAQGGATITIYNVVAAENGWDPTAGNPAINVVLQNVYSQSYDDNEVVEADWIESLTEWHVRLKGGGETAPPLRRFELTADKSLTSATATAKFMAFDNSLVGSPVTIHDPAQLFSGRTGFRGYALLRTDLGVTDPDRYEIVTMERYAEFIVVEKYAPSTYRFVSTLSSEDDWWRIAPAAVDADVSLNDPGEILDSIPTDQKVIARLSDPDTPTYDAISTFVSAGGKRVRGTVVDPGSGFVPHAAATFQLTSLTEVYGGTPPAAPLTVQQTFDQGYVAGQVTEAIFNEDSGLWENLPLPRKLGCHLDVDANGFEHVTAATLAGSGLSVSVGTGPGGCDQLTATGGGSLTAGCGILIASGVVSVDVADLAGSGLDVNTEGGACQLTVDLCEALEAKATADSKTSGTYVPAVVDGVCSLLEVVTGCDGS